MEILSDILHNVLKNMFKPLLLFFYMGFSIPIFRVAFEFPYQVYQGLTMYLLLSIGWKGGEEIAHLYEHAAQANNFAELWLAMGYMGVGFVTNLVIGLVAFVILRYCTKLRTIDAATISGYYGSTSAGTFVTCQGMFISLFETAKAAGDTQAMAAYTPLPYMPVMLAAMEIPGCIVALTIVNMLRNAKMDPLGNMPGEEGYDLNAEPVFAKAGHGGHGGSERSAAAKSQDKLSLNAQTDGPRKLITGEMLHEILLNPGLFLLFGGILIGFISALQGVAVTRADDLLFLDLFPALLCLFLLEMGITASRRLQDLKSAGWQFMAFGVLAPNLFAAIGLAATHAYCLATGHQMSLATYTTFAVLCAAASYIAVPAIQRLAIPEASPTLPLAAALGLTFSYNVTVGIPVYMLAAKWLIGNAVGAGPAAAH